MKIYSYCCRTLDDGIAEAVSTFIWVAPRLTHDVPELKVIADQLTHKYGKPYALVSQLAAIQSNGDSANFAKMMELFPQELLFSLNLTISFVDHKRAFYFIF